MKKRIPITAAKRIARKYDYDQVIILGRKIGEGGWISTYGKTRAHCDAAAQMGDWIRGLEAGDLKLTEAKRGSLQKWTRKPDES